MKAARLETMYREYDDISRPDEARVVENIGALLAMLQEILPCEDTDPPLPNSMDDVKINNFFSKAEDYKCRVSHTVIAKETAAVDEAFAALVSVIRMSIGVEAGNMGAFSSRRQ